MGTTFVTIGNANSDGDELGFWMTDNNLRIWLRLLALHIPEPTSDHSKVYTIRNQWLLASYVPFGGCTPHMLAESVSTDEGKKVVVSALDRLMRRLKEFPESLDPAVVSILGMEDYLDCDCETYRLKEIGQAFIDLIGGNLSCTVRSTQFMPGSH